MCFYCEKAPGKEAQQWQSVEKCLFEGVPTREVDQKVDRSVEDLLIDNRFNFLCYLISSYVDVVVIVIKTTRAR